MKHMNGRNVVVLLLLCAGWTNAAEKEWSVADAPVRHPFLLCTAEGLELAKKRVREEDWAKRLFAQIVENARQLESSPCRFSTSSGGKSPAKKRVQDIYPEVHRYAGRVWIGRCED